MERGGLVVGNGAKVFGEMKVGKVGEGVACVFYEGLLLMVLIFPSVRIMKILNSLINSRQRTSLLGPVMNDGMHRLNSRTPAVI